MAPRIPRPSGLSGAPSAGPIMPKIKTGRAPNPAKVSTAPTKKPAQYVPPIPRPTPTTTVPSSTPQVTVSGSLETVPAQGTIEDAEAQLNSEKRKAARLGVPLVSPLPTRTSTPAVTVSGPLETLPEAKSDGGGSGFWGQAIGLLGVGTRASASLLKEASDIFNGGDASFTDVWDQFADPEYGYGKAFPEPLGIKNKWIAYPLHFALDIALDPTTYLTFGGSAIAKTLVRSGVQLATKEVAQAAGKKVITELTEESVEALSGKIGRDLAVKLVDDVAEVSAAKTAREAAQASLDEAIGFGDDIARETAQQVLDTATIALRESDRAVQESISNAAIALGGKGGTILSKEASRQLAHETWVQAVGTAGEKAAKQALDKATEELSVSAIFRGGVRRGYGRQASLDLADNARLVRDDALNVLGDASASGARRASAQKVVEDLSDEVIADIAKRGYQAIQKDVARALGTTGKTRLGVGKFSTYVPGVGSGRKLIYRGLNTVRLGAISSGPGREIAELLTPRGRQGLLDPKQIVKLKTALRTGTDEVGRKLDPEQAVDYLSLLRANDSYRFVRSKAASETVTLAKNALRGAKKADLKAVKVALDSGDTSVLTPAQQELFANVNDFFLGVRTNTLLDAGRAGGTPGISRLTTVPVLKTAQADRWLQLNPTRAQELAAGLNIDEPSLFADVLNDSLIPGATLFGRTLTKADIAGGVTRLNQIAREAGKLNFDLFETDLGNIVTRFGEKAADIRAYSEVVKSLADEGRVAREAGKTVVQVSTKQVNNEIDSALDEMMTILDETFKPSGPGQAVVERWTPNELERITRDLDTLTAELLRETDPTIARGFGLDPFPGSAKATTRNVDEVLELIDGVKARAAAINEAINTGADYRVGALFKIESGDALKKTIDAARERVDKNFELIANRLVDPAWTSQNWSRLTRSFDDGFTSIAGSQWKDFPDIGVRTALKEIFDNVNEINKPGVAKNFGAFVNTYNNFFKSWMTASPGFHIRNAIGNAWTLFTAGADPRNGIRATNWMNQYLVKNRNALRGSKEFITPEEFVAGLKASDAEKQNILQSLLILDDIQGQVADAIGGGRVGIFGGTATGQLPGANLPGVGTVLRRPQRALDATRVTDVARGVSVAAGSPLRVSRATGTWIENNARVALMYDGLTKGLTPQEALTRVNKYLFDYQDLSAADQVLKQIIPFWLWGSRNFPLVIENMVSNPRAYKTYAAFERNFMEDENNLPEIFGPNGIYYPESLRRAGTGVIREGLPGAGRVLPLDLGFPGAAKPSIFQEAVEFFVPGGEGDARQLLSAFASQSPYSALIEYTTGTDLYFDKRIDDPASQLAGNLFAPGVRIEQISDIISGEGIDRRKAIEAFTGIPGLVGREPRESEVRSEILRQYYEQKARNEAAAKE